MTPENQMRLRAVLYVALFAIIIAGAVVRWG